MYLAAHTAQPGSLPRILQQTLRLGRGFSRPPPLVGPGDLIVLKHSSYHLIFRCPLSLVSDLHICWNTVGCSLCSSDQLGISLVLRGSGLLSHLSCCHLLSESLIAFFTLPFSPLIQSPPPSNHRTCCPCPWVLFPFLLNPSTPNLKLSFHQKKNSK